MKKLAATISSSKIAGAATEMEEIEKFLHSLSNKLDKKKLKNGADIASYIKTYKLKKPALFGDEKITYTVHDEKDKNWKKLVIVTRPEKEYADPVARKIFCVKIGRVTACLECGWLWCSVVIYIPLNL